MSETTNQLTWTRTKDGTHVSEQGWSWSIVPCHGRFWLWRSSEKVMRGSLTACKAKAQEMYDAENAQKPDDGVTNSRQAEGRYEQSGMPTSPLPGFWHPVPESHLPVTLPNMDFKDIVPAERLETSEDEPAQTHAPAQLDPDVTPAERNEMTVAELVTHFAGRCADLGTEQTRQTLARLDKGVRRMMRKAMHRLGRPDLAALRVA